MMATNIPKRLLRLRDSCDRFLNRQIDASSLAIYRILFGGMMFLGVLRFFLKGWIHKLYIEPTYYFTYDFFHWVHPWPATFMYLHFLLLGIAALFVALGLFYRFSIIVFFLGFTYIELLDKSNYLNHYYLISLLAFLMIWMPLHRRYSLDVSLRKLDLPKTASNWTLQALRFQIAIVYFFAGIAKLNPDWLLEAQPLRIWLSANSDFPLLGTFFDQAWCGYLFSWTGVIFDLSVPFLLYYSKTRKYAYLFVIFFHVLTWRLFPIGLFPWVMITATSLFFSPSWPESLFKRFQKKQSDAMVSPKTNDLERNPAYIAIALAMYFALQIMIPLRHFLYPGNVLWTEEGFRFSWKVMVMEKNGFVEYRVEDLSGKRRWTVNPKEYLVPHQIQQMSTQPDMILELARKIHTDFLEKKGIATRVYADSDASLNGRLSQTLIDPKVDLTKALGIWSHQAAIMPFRAISTR